MSEREIMERLDRIRDICMELSARFELIRQQGRLPGMDDARWMDERSQDLQNELHALPQDPCSSIEQPERRRQAADVLEFSRSMLEMILASDAQRSEHPPRAAASRLMAYSTY